MTSRNSRHRHANRWVLIDARMQLLSVGTDLYQGTSPRSALDATARHVLIPRMRNAAVDGRERNDTARHDGQIWHIQIIPICGPVSQDPIAILGCYGPDERHFPDPPMCGAWEWLVTPPGPDQQMRTYWSSSLYDVYDIPRPGAAPDAPSRQWWEGPQWLDELIHESDRPDMRRQLDGFIHADNDGLFIHSYRVHSPVTGSLHRLRFAGRSYVADHAPERWFRGVSTRIDDFAAVPDAPPSTAGVMDATFAVTADPLCAIDTLYEHIYLTSATFSSLGIALPTHRHLPVMTHPEDLQVLRTFLKEAAERTSGATGPVQVRFATPDHGWRALALTGTSLRISGEETHHILCRVNPVATEW